MEKYMANGVISNDISFFPSFCVLFILTLTMSVRLCLIFLFGLYFVVLPSLLEQKKNCDFIFIQTKNFCMAVEE